ncbi:hypothetical protein P3W45_001727 [Vairimorpha bombi]|jgi:hypothetical protein
MVEDLKTELNKKFVKKCEEYMKRKKPFTKLIRSYKFYINDNTNEEDITFDVSEESPAELTSHYIQSSDDDMLEKKKIISFKNYRLSEDSDFSDHRCGGSEIYKFLVNYYGVNCPVLKKTHKKRKFINTQEYQDGFEWPFLEPPTKPRTVFDNGPTREEIGEYNRRIFAAYTEYLDSQNNIIPYYHNPKFFDDDSDEESCNEYSDNLYKSEIETFLYNGTDYIFTDKCVVRISKDLKGEQILSVKGKKYKMELPIDSFKLHYVENELKIDLLNLDDLTISRYLFSDDKHSRSFYEYFDVPCE